MLGLFRGKFLKTIVGVHSTQSVFRQKMANPPNVLLYLTITFLRGIFPPSRTVGALLRTPWPACQQNDQTGNTKGGSITV